MRGYTVRKIAVAEYCGRFCDRFPTGTECAARRSNRIVSIVGEAEFSGDGPCTQVADLPAMSKPRHQRLPDVDRASPHRRRPRDCSQLLAASGIIGIARHRRSRSVRASTRLLPMLAALLVAAGFAIAAIAWISGAKRHDSESHLLGSRRHAGVPRLRVGHDRELIVAPDSSRAAPSTIGHSTWTLRRISIPLFQIIMIDLVLAGDNAIIVGLAASRVAPALRRRVIFWGIAGAVVLRILFAGLTTQLLADRRPDARGRPAAAVGLLEDVPRTSPHAAGRPFPGSGSCRRRGYAARRK